MTMWSPPLMRLRVGRRLGRGSAWVSLGQTDQSALSAFWVISARMVFLCCMMQVRHVDGYGDQVFDVCLCPFSFLSLNQRPNVNPILLLPTCCPLPCVMRMLLHVQPSCVIVLVVTLKPVITISGPVQLFRSSKGSQEVENVKINRVLHGFQ